MKRKRRRKVNPWDEWASLQRMAKFAEREARTTKFRTENEKVEEMVWGILPALEREEIRRVIGEKNAEYLEKIAAGKKRVTWLNRKKVLKLVEKIRELQK